MTLALILMAAFATADEPAVTVRVEWPELMLEGVLALFKGSRAPDPATALANWKRATKGKQGLGKGYEAAIAAMNPSMVRELRTLDGSRFVLDFAGKDGVASWSFEVPEDDGMFAAFATAMALTDGKSEPPLDGAEVDRLGNKPGASLMARSGERVVIADSREALACALAMAPEPSMRGIDRQLGRARVRVSAAGLTRSSRPDLHAVGEALLGLGCSTIAVDALVGPNGPLFIVRIPRVPAGPGAKLDPARLAEIPASASAAFSFPIDDRPESWDRLFAAIDRAERADPARRDRSPLRARIGLAARVGGIDLERDVWPKLRGATGFMVGPPRKPDGVALALHLVDDESAATFRDRVLPRFAKLLGLAPASGPGPNADSKPLADVAGRTVWVSTRFPKTVWIGWGAEGIPITFREGHPAKLVDPMEARDREQLKENHRFGWIIPGRFDLAPAGSPLAEAIAASGPIRWYGRDERTSTDDVLRWDGLDRGIRRYLELIPQEPAPASQK